MKNQLEKIIQDKKDLLKLDSSKNGLRLDWVNENNYSVYFKGVKYTPDNFSDLTFIDSVLEGKELSNDKRIEKLFKKQAKDALKKEEKYDGQKNDEGKKNEKDDEGKGNEKKDEEKKDVEEEIIVDEPTIVEGLPEEPVVEEPVVEVEKLEEEQPAEEPVRRGRGRPPKNN